MEMLRSSMNVILKDFSYESVFRYLRSGYSLTDPEAADILDNYILATGIRGKKKWSSNFIKRSKDYQPDDQPIVSDITDLDDIDFDMF